MKTAKEKNMPGSKSDLKKIHCENCFFWDCFCKAGSNGRDEDAGVCHRYPPILDANYAAVEHLIATEDEVCYVQPITDASEWCGEFKIKP